MDLDLWLTLAVLAGAVVLFVTEKLRVDVVALLVLSSLLVLGIVTPREALSGFSSQATITVAAMFVLSAGLQRSGVIDALGELLARIRVGWLFALVMMVLVAATSAFINNTAVMAVFLPVVIAANVANRLSPSRFLIPLSFAAQMGGVCTLIGTSTNLVVDSLARQSGQRGFELFEFAPLGLWFAGAGVLYLLVARSFLLPDRGLPATGADEHRGRYMAELHVPAGASAEGRTGGALLPAEADGVALLAMRRQGAMVPTPHQAKVAAGDRLLLRGDWHQLQQLRKKQGLAFDPVARDLSGNPEESRLHAELMVAPGSHLVGRSLAQVRFGHTYRARVHGLQRAGVAPVQPPHKVPLAVGDILLVDATEAALQAMQADPGLLLLRKREQKKIDPRRAVLSLLILAGVMGVTVAGWMPIVASSLLGCVALVVLRCLEPDEAYAAIDWRVIVLLAGVLPLGLALQNHGAADWVAQRALGLLVGLGPTVLLATVYLLTAVLTEVMSNNAAAVLVVPVAIATADTLGVDARPFLVAVAFAASTSFATPVGYQTNAMAYSAGAYRFTDFARIGIPLNLMFWLMAIVLIPRYFPF
jgi:di/tricarboxylate transporter